jgi:hypothetical protein
MHAMLRDAFGVHEVGESFNSQSREVDKGTSGGDALKYHELLKTAEKPLHPGTKHSKLSAIVHMYNLKCVEGISNNFFFLIFSSLLVSYCLLAIRHCQLIHTRRKISSVLWVSGMRRTCHNDFMLFWKDNKDLDICTVCRESKWMADIHLDQDGEVISSRKKCPVKVLRWFPLIPHLHRLFMSEHTAHYMRWHAEGRIRDGVLRHPADGEEWRSFDILHLDFMAGSRNVRLGLTADGFNPFGNMSTSHSTWPILLVPYNLPPWMCMKQTSFILSLVILGPSSPGMDIDVYLQPLIDELLEL